MYYLLLNFNYQTITKCNGVLHFRTVIYSKINHISFFQKHELQRYKIQFNFFTFQQFNFDKKKFNFEILELICLLSAC